MATLSGIEERLREAVEALPAGLRDHVLRVEREAERLARLHGVDRQRSRIAALGHDLVRHETDARLLALAEHYGVETDPIERASPVLVHGPVAARMLSRDYGLDDADVLAGIDCHTTARAGMTAVEKVLFVADKVEEDKLARHPELVEVYDLSLQDLDAALRRFLDLHFERALRKGWQIHPRSLEARNELIFAAGQP